MSTRHGFTHFKAKIQDDVILANSNIFDQFFPCQRFTNSIQIETIDESFRCLVRQYVDQEIAEHKIKGRLPSTFTLNQKSYYEKLARIRSRSERLVFLRSLISTDNTPPVFAVPYDSGGVHNGFFTPFRTLRQGDLVDMATWNYLKAQRLGEHLYLNCANISSLPLAQLLIDMRAKFNLLSEPWWPILVGISEEKHEELIEILQTKYQLHGAHLNAWETRENLSDTKDFTLICSNRGETIFELDPAKNYIVQIDGDEKRCCLGNAPQNSETIYKNVVKLESRIKTFHPSRQMLTSDLFTVLAHLKVKGFFYKKMKKTLDDETHNIKWKAHRGLISH